MSVLEYFRHPFTMHKLKSKLLLLFTRCATSNASRHFKSPLAMGRDAFKPKHASSVSISEVIDTGVNSNKFLLHKGVRPMIKKPPALLYKQAYNVNRQLFYRMANCKVKL